MLFVLFLLLLVVLLGWRIFKTKNKTESGPADIAEEAHALDEDEKKVIEALEANEGRVLQRELRQQLKFSETKMSLLLDELEIKRIIKRIKKGRGNIIKLVKRDGNG